MTTIAIFLGALAARLVDPIAIVLCAGSAAMIGAYRVAVPVGGALYLAIVLAIGVRSPFSLAVTAIAGCILSAIGLFLWRKVPSSFKQKLTNEPPDQAK